MAKQLDSETREYLHLWIEPSLKMAIQEAAAADQRSLSAWVRMVLKRELEVEK